MVQTTKQWHACGGTTQAKGSSWRTRKATPRQQTCTQQCAYTAPGDTTSHRNGSSRRWPVRQTQNNPQITNQEVLQAVSLTSNSLKRLQSLRERSTPTRGPKPAQAIGPRPPGEAGGGALGTMGLTKTAGPRDPSHNGWKMARAPPGSFVLTTGLGAGQHPHENRPLDGLPHGHPFTGTGM